MRCSYYRRLLALLGFCLFFVRVQGVSANADRYPLFDRAAELFAGGQHEEAANTYELAIRSLEDSDISASLAITSSSRIGLQFEQIHRPDIALKFYEMNAEYQLAAFGKQHTDLANSYDHIGSMLFVLGNYAEARRYYEMAYEIRVSVLEPGDSVLADSFNNLGSIFEVQGDYTKAIEYYGKSLSILLKAETEETPRRASVYSNLGNAYSFVADYAQAVHFHREGLRIRLAVLGAEHSDVAASYVNLGAVYQSMGALTKARDYFEKSCAIKTVLQEFDPALAVALTSLGSVYMALGDPAKAQEYILQALVIRVSVLGEEHSDTGSSYGSLGAAYFMQGNFRQASDLFRRSLGIKMKTVGATHPDVADLCNNIASIYFSLGRYEETLKYYTLGRDIRVDVFGAAHTDVAQSLHNMAVINTVLRNYGVAVDLAGASHAMRKELLGENHLHVVDSLRSLSLAQQLAGDLQGTLSSAVLSAATHLRFLRREFPLLTARERTLLLSVKQQVYLDVLLSVALGGGAEVRADAGRASALWLLRTKGLILSTLIEDRELLHNVPEAGPLTERLRAAKAQLSALTLQQAAGESEEQLEAREVRIRELSTEVEGQERELARLAAQQREGRPEPEEIELTDVQQALAAGQALVEMYRFRPLSDAAEHKESGSLYRPDEYAAIVIRPDVREPVVLSLGDAESLDDTVYQLLSDMRAGEPVAPLLKKLHYQIWAPLAGHIGDAGRVYISPDSELSFVPFAALLGPDGKYLCEHHEIGYTASGRDLLTRLRQGDPGAPALFGDPAFGEEVNPNKYILRGGDFHSVLEPQDRAVISGLRFPQLPGTQREVRALKQALKASDQNPVAYLGAEATESRLKSLERPGLLHLATHGFFLSDMGPGSDSGVGARMSLDGADTMAGPVRVVNPMLRSGLALTGAALAAVKREDIDISGTDDGIVTAEEVSSLDLLGTRIVVLSACDTGVGEARAGQGVMGLRRAFAHAGARNLVMTLWPVQDEATVNLMVSFYERYLETDDAIGALSHLQRSSIAQAREAGKVPDPRLWGAFLISVQGR